MPESNANPFSDDLAEIASGDTATVERHLDLLAQDDAARDLRHDVQQIASDLEALAGEYVHPASFTAELLEAIPDTADETDETDETADAGCAPESEPTTPPSKRPASFWGWAGTLVAAAAGLTLMLATPETTKSSSSEQGVVATVEVELLTAKILQLERSVNDNATGLQVLRAGTNNKIAASVGLILHPGDSIQSDARTRVRLAMSDQSEITLAPSSSLLLHDSHARTLILQSGELVADVAHLEGATNAQYHLPNARIEVLGTKFSLTADGDYSNLRVLRGKVAMYGNDESKVVVRAGEEASADATHAPSVSPALHLSQSVHWAELGTAERGHDSGEAGLGQLRAYKPGHSQDKDWPMALQSHRVRVRLVGNIARTEIEEVFRNDSNTVLEGVYKFPLPPDAKIDKLALDVDGRFEEGAIVEKQRANRIWKGVIANATSKKPRRPQDLIWVPGPWKDPALLEQKEGNQFELRIFPIPKRGTRTIKLAYTQIIKPQGERRRYTYALPHSADGSSVAESFHFDMQLSGIDAVSPLRTPGYAFAPTRDGQNAQLTLSETSFIPNGDLVVEYLPQGRSSELRAWTFAGQAATRPKQIRTSRRAAPRPAVLAEQERLANDSRAYALIALKPILPRWTQERPRDLVITIDSSQSMVGQRFQRASQTALAMINEMSARDRVMVMVCDIRCQSFAESPIRPGAQSSRELATWLASISPAGASFLENTLKQGAIASGTFESSEDERDAMLVYIGDGVATMGHKSLAVLQEQSSALKAHYNTSISTVAIGADSSSRTLETLARAGGGFHIEHRSGRSAEQIALALLESTIGVALQDAQLILPEGMSAVSPASLSTLRAGDEFLVSARFGGTIDGMAVLRGSVGGKAYENSFPLYLQASTSRANAFVPKLWASQSIAALETQSHAGRSDTMVALSKSYGVLSPQTSLLVLESEAMFRAFGIDRSRPAVEWTGEEGEALVSESMGEKGYGGILGGEVMGRGFSDDAGEGSGARQARAPSKRKGRANKKRPRPSPAGDIAPQLEAAVSRSRPGPSRGRWMQRVWSRVAKVHPFFTASQERHRAVERAERALTLQPHSRGKHRQLVRALTQAHLLQRAEEVTHSWLERDQLDVDALSFLADITARQGRRIESLRILSGVVDLRPEDPHLHRRLANAYTRSAQSVLACAHRVMLAEVDPSNVESLARAIACEQSNGRALESEALLVAVPLDLRARTQAQALAPVPGERIRGELRLSAQWNGDSDLDIAIITPSGRRVSWQGGHRRVTADHVHSRGIESLALPRLRKGEYLIEITRSSPDDRSFVNGSLQIHALGARRRIPFELVAANKTVARVKVRSVSRLVPL